MNQDQQRMLIQNVRTGLQAVTLGASILKEQLEILEADPDSMEVAGLSGKVLSALETEAQTMGRELAGWSRDIREGLDNYGLSRK